MHSLPRREHFHLSPSPPPLFPLSGVPGLDYGTQTLHLLHWSRHLLPDGSIPLSCLSVSVHWLIHTAGIHEDWTAINPSRLDGGRDGKAVPCWISRASARNLTAYCECETSSCVWNNVTQNPFSCAKVGDNAPIQAPLHYGREKDSGSLPHFLTKMGFPQFFTWHRLKYPLPVSPSSLHVKIDFMSNV